MRPIKVYKKGRTVRASSLNNPIILYLKLISHNRIEFLGLVDHALHLGNRGHAAADMPGLVDFGELWLEVRGHAVAELLDSVYPGGLEQLGELPCHTPYAEKVGVVGPFENQGGRDARGLGECLAPPGGRCGFQQVVSGGDSGRFEFGGVSRPYTLDFDNLVCHNIKSWLSTISNVPARRRVHALTIPRQTHSSHREKIGNVSANPYLCKT